jgi:predicted dehydrogenase
MRLGLISTARINSAILSAAAASDIVNVVAVGSRDPSRAKAYAHEHGLERAYGSYEALLADPDLDAVYNSLPNGLHHEWTMKALEAGKHVLCEKPYSRRPQEVEDAFDRAERAELVLMEAFMYRHHPRTAKLKSLVGEGAVGRMHLVRGTFSFVLEDQSDPRARPELDGGALMDVGCYCVSGVRLLAGEPERVSTEQVLGPTGIDMSLHAIMRFADDVVALFDCSFDLPLFQRLEVVGDEGSLLLEAPWRADWTGDLFVRRDGEVTKVEFQAADAYLLELENFADAIAGTAPPLLGRADALGQARTIAALYRAAVEGRAIALDEL